MRARACACASVCVRMRVCVRARLHADVNVCGCVQFKRGWWLLAEGGGVGPARVCRILAVDAALGLNFGILDI